MVPDRYTIRPMSRAELGTAMQWAAAEGWNPGLFDGDCFHAADPEGFLMGFLGDEPIGSISAVRYDPGFGFIGLYIVRPAWRGQGYGLPLWQAALNHLQGRTIGLDGVLAQQANYARSGFHLAHRNIRYGGQGGGRSLVDSPNLVPLVTQPFDWLLHYDRRFYPAERAEFLQSWISQPDSHAVAQVSEEQLTGYGLLRPCQTGYKIGPLFADTPAVAAEILAALVAKVPSGGRFYLDVPDCNGAAVALAEKYGMEPVFETARMYAGETPNLPLQQIFGITTFELG